MQIQIGIIGYDDVNNQFSSIHLVVDGHDWDFYVDSSTENFNQLWDWCKQCATDFKSNGYSSSAYTLGA